MHTVVDKTLRVIPAEAIHWSTHTMARVVGLGKTSIPRIWREHRLKPHLVKTFKVSRDPAFVDKMRNMVGLSLNPPEHALVLTVDEKSQIQALGRMQEPLELVHGYPARRTHDYTRYGTTTLFAALNVASGGMIKCCMMRHRHQECLRFLATIFRSIADLRATINCYLCAKPRIQAFRVDLER